MSRSALFIWISALGIWVLSLSLGAAPETAASLLERAQALAWLDNWTEAGPLFAEAEKLFVASGDERNALYARIGRTRFESERMPYAEVSEFFATQLANPVVASDPQLKLWCLAAKGYTDLQIAPLSAKKAWEELMAVAQELGQQQWISRANGELGIIAFLEGDSGKAQRQVGQALQSARSSGDVAAQVRYLSMIGQGVAELGRFKESLFYFDQALALANTHRDGPYPYIAISGKATALSALSQEPRARQLLTQALENATNLGRRGQQTDLLRLLGILDEKSDNRAGAVHHYEEAISLATEGQFYRELADTLIRAAKIYQQDGSLDKAEQHAAHGVQVSRKVGDTYFLPRYLTALAEIKAALGKLQVAEALYDEAQDIIKGMLVFVPSLRMKSSLVAAMSEATLSQFRTNVELLQNPSRAFQVIA